VRGTTIPPPARDPGRPRDRRRAPGRGPRRRRPSPRDAAALPGVRLPDALALRPPASSAVAAPRPRGPAPLPEHAAAAIALPSPRRDHRGGPLRACAADPRTPSRSWSPGSRSGRTRPRSPSCCGSAGAASAGPSSAGSGASGAGTPWTACGRSTWTRRAGGTATATSPSSAHPGPPARVVWMAEGRDEATLSALLRRTRPSAHPAA